MREHMGLFRGKRIDNGEWVEGAFCPKNSESLWGGPKGKHHIIKLDAPFSGFWFEVDPDAVGECTGLRDKNGKLIFEGDIVNIHVPNGFDMTGVVEYYDYGFEVRDEENGAYECLWYSPSVISILGNIHDNPELLKGGEDDG